MDGKNIRDAMIDASAPGFQQPGHTAGGRSKAVAEGLGRTGGRIASEPVAPEVIAVCTGWARENVVTQGQVLLRGYRQEPSGRIRRAADLLPISKMVAPCAWLSLTWLRR